MACAAGVGNSGGSDFWPLVGRLYESVYAGGVSPISADNADELFYVMAPDCEDGQTVLAELRGAVNVPVLSTVHQFVLNESAEFRVSTLHGVMSVDRDQEVRDSSEPLFDLLPRAGLGPLAHRAGRIAKFGLPDDPPTCPGIWNSGPKHPNFGKS